MLFFFGTRASKIKDRKLRRTTCPYCETKDSFVVSTYSKYFHFFWIPIIPLFKTNIAECSHCKKTYSKHEFTVEMNTALQKVKETNPVKKPIWQGFGCILLVGFFSIMFAISFYGVHVRSNEKGGPLVEKDSRKELLENDIKQLRSILKRDKDSIAFILKQCINYDIQNGIETNKIKYFTKINQDKLLIILGIKDLKQIKSSERKVIIDVVEDCIAAMPNMENISKYYIGVEGKWNTVLVKTPTSSDLGGRFADKYKLLPFYGKMEIKSDVKIDSSTKKK